MKKMLFAFAAILLGSGAALAESAPASVVVNPDHVVQDRIGSALELGYTGQQALNNRDGDAAPNVNIVAAGQIDRTGVAAIQAPSHAIGFNDRYGDAQPSVR
ncbi:hypothetical protein EET67_06580 [Pseudaminobacter arsenicus]|uniref:Phage infection protein n=1 Tax=Borborobacter arsenicus TaxID=1851146 RepID=A0A432V9J2_9HYPH|nr:hypothetical protein [Pseudaminobacter arsenicus]RUM98763.1 hypothetical protein EET67_06580 [Pseudaminobacter arsenicus]